MKTLMLTIAAVGLCLGACNTMTRGTESEVTITASPRGARIWTSLGHRCPSSPCVVKVERKTDFIAYRDDADSCERARRVYHHSGCAGGN